MMEQLIARLYEAALAPGPMNDFLDEYAERLKASGAVLVAAHVKGPSGMIIGSARTDVSYNQKYSDYYGSINVYLAKLRMLSCMGEVRPGEELVPEAELVRTEYYNDYLRPQDVHYSLGVAFHFAEGLHVHLGAVRSKHAGAFDQAERQFAEAIAPHVGQAVRLRARLEIERCGAEAWKELAQGLPFGLFQLNAKGAILESNGVARKMLNARDGIKVEGGFLKAMSATDARTLSSLICSAARPMPGQSAGGAMCVSRPSGNFPYVVNVFPFRPGACSLPCPELPSVLIFVTDPEDSATVECRRMRQAFGLTEAETRICQALLSGKEMKEIAEDQRITTGTARTHLKRIFWKTQTFRQAELLRLLLRSFPTCRED